MAITINIINRSKHSLPSYQTDSAAGMDLKADLQDPVEIKPLERALIPTGLYIELPKGYEAQIRPRSGLAIKHGISLLNTPGTIDADYRGEIKIIIVNLSNETYTVKDGDRIAQMIIAKHEKVSWNETMELAATAREDGGFGSTGSK